MKKLLTFVFFLLWTILLCSIFNSCSAGFTMGRNNSVTQTITNKVDSVSTIFKVGK